MEVYFRWVGLGGQFLLVGGDGLGGVDVYFGWVGLGGHFSCVGWGGWGIFWMVGGEWG